jgi:hypothetical protein
MPGTPPHRRPPRPLTRRQSDQRRALRILLATLPTINACVIRRTDSRDDWHYVLWQNEEH